MVKPNRYHELMKKTPETIFAAIVARYGEKLADELAAFLLSNEPIPPVTWPRF